MQKQTMGNHSLRRKENEPSVKTSEKGYDFKKNISFQVQSSYTYYKKSSDGPFTPNSKGYGISQFFY